MVLCCGLDPVTSLNGRKGPGFMDSLDLSKYDVVHELMTKAKAATVDSKYDPIRWLFDSVGSWQPKETIVRTFLKNVDSLSNDKYDMLQVVLEDLRKAGAVIDISFLCVVFVAVICCPGLLPVRLSSLCCSVSILISCWIADPYNSGLQVMRSS